MCSTRRTTNHLKYMSSGDEDEWESAEPIAAFHEPKIPSINTNSDCQPVNSAPMSIS